MTQYNILNVKLSNSQLNRLKSRIKNGTKVTLKLSSNAAVDSMMRIIFRINCYNKIQVSRLRKALGNGSSANIKLSKTQLNKIWQSAGILGRFLEPLLKTALPLMKNCT